MSASRRRLPSRAELALWRSALKDVVPLHGGIAPEPSGASSSPDEIAPAQPEPKPRPRETGPREPLALPEIDARSAPGLDRRSAERLKRGQMPIEARIDLHGLTQAEAHRALDGFLARAQRETKRCVLVITGKGMRKPAEEGGYGETGILRSAVPRWLNEAPNRARILAFAWAQPNHGGGGALYVLLRRHR